MPTPCTNCSPWSYQLTSLIPAGYPRRRSLEINSLYPSTDLRTLSYKISKVLPCHLTLNLDFVCVTLFLREMFDRALQTDAQVVGGDAQDFANFGSDAGRVGVRIVQRVQAVGKFVAKALGEGVRDRCQGVGCGKDN